MKKIVLGAALTIAATSFAFADNCDTLTTNTGIQNGQSIAVSTINSLFSQYQGDVISWNGLSLALEAQNWNNAHSTANATVVCKDVSGGTFATVQLTNATTDGSNSPTLKVDTSVIKGATKSEKFAGFNY
ncbi:hypothetical protein [Piscirickettsia litoralis]|uniref:Spore coat protein U domain-containing protein n=1 Tax=Piscirickettsia litoralis TaxID=1891921 RepID=A0ABX3A1N8_9GAMM|nr:hypothetical protein [Piscirickettsia litoralis]ODN42405.1 hypothetical protein BGC07_04990 [Piscirickettsia litoralis]